MGKVRVQVWGKGKLDWEEHTVEVMKRWNEGLIPDPKACVLLKLDGEEVMVERFTVEDWRKLREQEEKEPLRIRSIWVYSIDINNAAVDHLLREEDRGKVKIPFTLKQPLVIYRLLWYFGPPYRFQSDNHSTCNFLVKYKGHVFRISDDAEKGHLLDIDALILVPKDMVWPPLDEEKRIKYAPPPEIREEISAIIEYLAKNPVMIYHSPTGEYLPT